MFPFRILFFGFWITCGSFLLYSEDNIFKKNVEVKLIEPTYKGGVLTSTKGGTVKGQDFFLQARNIEYVRGQEKGKAVQKIFAEGELFFIFKGKAYVGDRVELNVEEKTAVIYNGCTSMEPWFVGGKVIELSSDGSGVIRHGYMTTSENEKSEWTVRSSYADVSKGTFVRAKNIGFYFAKLPILWVPRFSANLKYLRSSPFKYRFRWGGRRGPIVGITYDLIRTKTFRTELLLDLILKRGVGGGFATNYENNNGKQRFITYNYIAHDIIGKKEHKWLRYRFQGKYVDRWCNDQLNFRLTYDKLSDLDMRGDYPNPVLDSGRIAPTQALFTHKNKYWISTLSTQVRLNTFQTIKEELPVFEFNAKPFLIGSTGLLLTSYINAGYLNYKFANGTPHTHNFQSIRAELSQKLMRNFLIGRTSITPQVGYTLISYNRSPEHNAKVLAIGKAGVEAHTRFIRNFSGGCIATEPYLQYEYFTTPTIRPPRHYLFDLQDGWYRVNTLRFGLRNFLSRSCDDSFNQRFNLDLYARAFFDTPTVSRSIPRVYAEANWKATPWTSYSANLAWDTKRNNFDHLNVQGNWTISEDLALTLEYRQRNAFCWRKVDTENFIVDSFRKESRLRHSELSDRRNTILGHVFMRLSSTLALDMQALYGFHRKHQPSYIASQIDVILTFRNAASLTLSFQKRSREATRFSIEYSLGIEKPKLHNAPRIGTSNYANY